MKKLNRKLIPAFAMLLLSAVLMSTASFAWFTSNGKVTADGISITATAPAALWISDTANGTFAMSASLTAASKSSMNPVTQKASENTADNGSEWKFYYLKSDSFHKVGSNGQIAGGVADADLALDENRTNYIREDLFLKLEGKKAFTEDGKLDAEKMKVYAKVELVEPTAQVGNIDEIYKSIKIAIVTSSNTSKKAIADDTVYTLTGETKDDTSVCSTNGAVYFQPASFDVTAQQELFTIVAQEVVTVYVYVWFEGTDEFCKNANAMDLEDFGIKITLGEKDPAQGGGNAG